jgi:hypothetical protein
MLNLDRAFFALFSVVSPADGPRGLHSAEGFPTGGMCLACF